MNKYYGEVRKSVIRVETVLKAEEGDKKTVFGKPMEYHSGKWSPAEGGSAPEEDSGGQENSAPAEGKTETSTLDDGSSSKIEDNLGDWMLTMRGDFEDDLIDEGMDDSISDLSDDEFYDEFKEAIDAEIEAGDWDDEDDVKESAGCPDTPRGQRTGKRDGTQGATRSINKSYSQVISDLKYIRKSIIK